MNLIEKLGLEKCQAIVDGAPETTTIFSLANNQYYRPNTNPFYPPEKPVWTRIWINADGLVCNETRFLEPYMSIELADLRTAITTNNNTDHCTDIRNHISPLTGVIER